MSYMDLETVDIRLKTVLITVHLAQEMAENRHMLSDTFNALHCFNRRTQDQLHSESVRIRWLQSCTEAFMSYQDHTHTTERIPMHSGNHAFG